MPKLIDLTGRMIGNLTVISRDVSKAGVWWNCLCKCGNSKSITSTSLRDSRNKTSSCGCLANKLKSLAKTKHGQVGTKEYLLFKKAQERAKAKGLDFNLVISDIKIPEFCPLLGVSLDKDASKTAANSPSLDRIDSSLGYVRGNVWVISHRANAIKNNATLQELKLITQNLEKRQNEIFQAESLNQV